MRAELVGLRSRLPAIAIFACIAALGQSAEAEGIDAQTNAQAKAHAKAGNEYLNKDLYREALEEFQKAMTLKRTRGAMASVASTLKLLGRYDESLELFEQILREFKDLPGPFATKINSEMVELNAMMGTLVLTGEVPKDASVFIDDRLRGKLPLLEPIRLSRGIRTIRIQKERFPAIIRTEDIRSGIENRINVAVFARYGYVSIREKHNWPLLVEIDGKDVGTSPWEGLVEAGRRRIRLHGFVDVDALITCDVPDYRVGQEQAATDSSIKVVSSVSTVPIDLYEETSLVLKAIDVDTFLRIESTPDNAIVMIDYTQVGMTPWRGRLPLGQHVVEVNAAGYNAVRQRVMLERLKEREVTVVLEPSFAGNTFSARKRVAWISGYTLGLLGISFGTITGILATNAVDEIRERCGGTTCAQNERTNLQRANTLANYSTVSFLAAGASVVAGTIAILIPEPKPIATDSGSISTVIQAQFGLGGFNLKASF